MKIFDYEDIQLIPNKCIVNSRSACDTTVQFGPKTFKLPVVPANMQTVMNESLAEWFAEMIIFILCIVLMKQVAYLYKKCKIKDFSLLFQWV